MARSHAHAHGPRVGSMSDDEPLRHDEYGELWTIRCPRCGRQTYTAEQMEAAPCSTP